MLRNPRKRAARLHNALLNEVLSLNAQECWARPWAGRTPGLLNEVLSLNAQELFSALLALVFTFPQ